MVKSLDEILQNAGEDVALRTVKNIRPDFPFYHRVPTRCPACGNVGAWITRSSGKFYLPGVGWSTGLFCECKTCMRLFVKPDPNVEQRDDTPCGDLVEDPFPLPKIAWKARAF